MIKSWSTRFDILNGTNSSFSFNLNKTRLNFFLRELEKKISFALVRVCLTVFQGK